MRELHWPVGLVLAFGLGVAAGGWLGRGPLATPETERLREVEHRLQSELTALRARVGASDPGVSGVPDSTPRQRAGAARGAESSAGRATAEAWARHVLSQRDEIRAVSAQAGGPDTTRTATPEVALDRFYRYLEEMSGPGGLARWQRMQQVTDELRGMGPAAVDAVMRVLASGASVDERRAAAQLLGELQARAAVPLLQDIVQKEGDMALRRAAVSGLRRIDSPETVPVLESLLTDSAEDWWIRTTAASGLAEMDRSQGVATLMQAFEESGLDNRGRNMAFRALTSLRDDRALPFMRGLATSSADNSYRVRAIRFLSSQSDRQALPTLQRIMQSPTEPAGVKNAAAQAYAAISGRTP